MNDEWLMAASMAAPLLGPAAPIASGIIGMVSAEKKAKAARIENNFNETKNREFLSFSESLASSRQKDREEANGQAWLRGQY